MAPTDRQADPSRRVLLGVAGVLALFGPLLVVLLVGWIASPTLALAAGLAVSLLLTMGLLAGGWWLLRQLEAAQDALTPSQETLTPALSQRERGFLPPLPLGEGWGEGVSPSSASSRILLVEDDPITQRIVARLLRQLDVQADIVGNGQAALDAVAAHQYALVLMDCQLPVLDGYAAAVEIRRREAAEIVGRAQRLPIIALSGSALDADRERALADGMDEHLTKPLDRERLAALLARWGVYQEGCADQPPPEIRTDREPILDPAGLPTVNGRLSEPYREIVQLYRQETARRMASLEAAAHVPDWPQIARIAHTLAGSSSSIGASRMAAACAALEVLAKGPENAPACPSMLGGVAAGHAHGDDALAGAVGRVRRELEQLDAALAHLTVERPPV